MNLLRAFTFAGLIIIVAGLVAVAAMIFHLLIEGVVHFAYGTTPGTDFLDHLATLSWMERLSIPTIGGLVVGLIFTCLKSADAAGEGVPSVLRAIQFDHSRIGALVIPIKMIATAITLGTGSSAGREGPVVQIGSGIGSNIAQMARQTEERTKLLLAAGAAAGISATFGAPLMGIIFSLELIIRSWRLFHLVSIALAAFCADVLMKLTGFSTGLPISISAPEAITLLDQGVGILVGIGAGLTAVLFCWLLRLLYRFHETTRLPIIVQTAFGGLVVGCIGLIVPAIHEPGTYETMQDLILNPAAGLLLLFLLLLAKIIATAVTLGSGGSGGIFAPALLMGLVVGLMVSSTLSTFDISHSIDSSLLVGLAAVFAAVTHAPITAIILIVELTDSLLSIPLVAIGVLAALTVARLLHSESAYSLHTTLDTKHLDYHPPQSPTIKT